MADYPQHIEDRLARLEQANADLRAELRGLQGRGESRAANYETRLARTVELANPASGEHGYPDLGDCRLPIEFLDLEYSSGSGELTRSTRQTSGPRAYVLSTFGWLPPSLEIEVAYYRGTWRTIHLPPLLHGKIYVGTPYDSYGGPFAAATWDVSCEELTPGGPESIQIYRDDGTGDYVAQEYSNNDPVLMYWYNFGDQMEENMLLTAGINADRQWVAWPETCDPCS